MKQIKFLLFIIIMSACSIKRKAICGMPFINIGYNAYNEINIDKIDTTKIKAVKIYSYKTSKKGKIKDSTLVFFENINFLDNSNPHTSYEIKTDSINRDYERYATRISNGEKHLNYRKNYDSLSNLIDWTIFNKDGQINSKTFYYYNTNNKIIKSESYYGHFLYDKPRLSNRTEFQYLNGSLIQEIEYSSVLGDSNLDSKTTTNYDKKNKYILKYKTEYTPEYGAKDAWGYKNNYTNGLLTSKEHFFKSDSIVEKTTYLYNSNEVLIKVYTENTNDKIPYDIKKYFYQTNKKTTHNAVYKT